MQVCQNLVAGTTRGNQNAGSSSFVFLHTQLFPSSRILVRSNCRTGKMAEQVRGTKSTPSFEYELFEGDPDQLRTVAAAPPPPRPWIAPETLKLKHRIGRGPFGDVWLATHHQSASDYDEFHEVSVKMLHPLDEEHVQDFVRKFENQFLKFRELGRVCWLHGISVIDKKICIAMRFYKGSVGDEMARLKGGRLMLSDVLRYGVDLASGLLQLHSLGLLVLNLKPSNFLIDDHDHLILGDFGIPYLLLGIPLSDPELSLRLGTPNYMAPEQWEPEIRGPISSETDSWGFGCSIIEMLTGIPPWFGKSTEEVYQSVVIKKEKPVLPSGFPPAVEKVISGCFEYDLRNRPMIADILSAFESSLDAVHTDGEWFGLGRQTPRGGLVGGGYTGWYLSKDQLQVGDVVRSRRPLNSRKSQAVDIPEGTVAGVDGNQFFLVKVPGMHYPLRVQQSSLERVTFGFAMGDWVRLKDENHTHSPAGILHSLHRDGSVTVGFLGLPTLWTGRHSEIQPVEPYFVGQFVRLKASIPTPRFEWPRKSGKTWATGRVSDILPNGCLVVGFPGRLVLGDKQSTFLADPAEVEPVSFKTCPGVVEKYQHIEDFHWVVRPFSVALGLFTTLKVASFVGRSLNSRIKGKKRNDEDGRGGKSSSWQRVLREAVPAASASAR